MRRPNTRMYRDTIEVYGLSYDADDEGNPIRDVSAPPTPYAAIVQPAYSVGTATSEDGVERAMSITSYDITVMSDGDPGIRIESPVTWVGHGFRRQIRVLGDATPHTFGAWRFQGSEVGPNPHMSGSPAGFTPDY